MRAVPLAAFTGMVILATGVAPARALPVGAPITTVTPVVTPPNLQPVRHHGRHWRGRYRYGGLSGVMPPNAPAPEIEASEVPLMRYPPAVGTQQPPAPATQALPDRGGRAATSRPSIDWVNPDRAGR